MVIHSNGICGGLCCRKFNMLPGFEDATSVANAILQAKAMMAQRSTAQAWPCLAGATGGAPQPMTMTAQSTMPMQMQSPGGEAGAYVSSPQQQAVPALVRGQSLSQYISSASEAELQQARELFNLIDKDGHGRISGVALRRVFRDSGVNASEREIDDLMFQLDSDGDGLVDFADFQRGIAFMQRAFGLDSTAGSNHNSPKANPRAELERLSFEAESAAAAAAAGRPTRQLSQSKLLRDVARKAKKHSSSTTANSPSPPVSPKPRATSSNSKATTPTTTSSKKSKKRSSSASNKKLGKLGLVDRDMASAEATETESMIDGDDETESTTDSTDSGDDVLGTLPPPDDFSPADAMMSFTKRKSSAAVFVQQLTPEQFGEIEKLFLKFDDGTGRISLANLELIVRRIDPGLPDSEVRKMIKSVDSGLSNSVGFEDFLRSMHALFKALRLKRALHRPQQTQQTTQALRETLRKRATLQRDVGRSTLPGFAVTDDNGSTATTTVAAAAATATAFTTTGGSATAATATAGGSRNSSKSSAMPQLRNSPSSLSLMDSQETSEDITSVDEALWRHVEMLEEELHAARQEIVLLSKLAKARQRESRVLGDPAEMAAWLVLQAQRDGEAGERASAAIANAVGNDDRLFRRVARVADQRRR